MFILFTWKGGGQKCLFYLLGREEGYNVNFIYLVERRAIMFILFTWQRGGL